MLKTEDGGSEVKEVIDSAEKPKEEGKEEIGEEKGEDENQEIVEETINKFYY